MLLGVHEVDNILCKVIWGRYCTCIYIYHISYVIIHKVDGAYTILYLVSQGDRQRYSQTNLQGGALVYDS